MYGARNVRLFCRIASGVGLLYVPWSWSKMSLGNIDPFHPVVGGFVAGATLKASLTCMSSVSYTAQYMFFHVLK